MLEDGFHPKVLTSYYAQLYLRKHLNTLHTMFYKPENEGSNNKPAPHYATVEASLENLETLHSIIPGMNWDKEHGEPAKDILEARLRAKYYGAKVITYRHFLLKFLNQSSTQSEIDETTQERFISEIKVPDVDNNATRLQDLDAKAVLWAECGIQALLHSTKAFYGMGEPGTERLIVTNVWGTAHA